ncbi:MAG: DUF6734 family protein [Candidatus Kapaibacterium sp.]
MRAVWSLWSKPLHAGRSVWISERQHLLAWILSVESARKHYPETALFTDDDGAAMLVEGIGLRFDHVSLELNALRDHDPEWWALGKIMTYRAQREPFIHIDNDVFLWKRLPERMERAPVCAQNPEYFMEGASYYKPELLEHALLGDGAGWLPEEWRWYRSMGGVQRAESCGIVGGSNTDFISYYADQAIRMVEHPDNARGWERLANRSEHNVLIEQYFLAACIEHQRHHAAPDGDIGIEYLFNSLDDAFVPMRASQAGYTHLIADSKKSAALAERLERRVARDYPELYERCVAFAAPVV